jgi:RecA/RadA recombinase
MDFLKDIVKEIGDDFTQLASDIEDTERYVDTGSFIFNGLVSGSIFGGVSGNKITAIAGESSTGKTFFSLAVVKNFLDSNPDGYCLYFDTEAAVNKGLLQSRGIDLDRLVVINVVTIEEFRVKALKAVDKYIKMPIEDRKPCMFVLDSLGMLSTEKEIKDALDDKQVRDMTKSQLVKGAFRMLTLKLGQANIPLIVTNHTYDVIGSYVPTKEMGGGSGLKYAASTIIYLSKKKEKDGKEIIGNIIKAKTHKSRLSKENKTVEIRLFYDDRGLDRYYGLLELGEIGGLWKNVAGRYEIGGKKLYAKQILSEPETYFNDQVMQALDEIAKNEFSYGLLCIETEKRQDINGTEFQEITKLISYLDDEPSEFLWLVNTTEKWCRDRAIYLALMESIQLSRWKG